MSESAAYPLLVFAISLAAQWLAAFFGSLLRTQIRSLGRASHQDIDIILDATVALLALIIGFSFSMAVTRYDQRKNYEEAEAKAIETAFLSPLARCSKSAAVWGTAAVGVTHTGRQLV